MATRRRSRSQSCDLISNLPTNIRDTILECLPLREAVRASILSKKWKYCWIHLPNLVFDETTFQVSKDDDKLLAKKKYVSIINQILLLHHGPILKFSFSHSLLKIGSEIDHIISFLSTSTIKEFDLRIGLGNTLSSWSYYSISGLITLVGGYYKLPSSFFSFRELRHLDLSDCVFSPPPTFEGFPRLISLKLAFVYFPTDLSGKLISKCPLLERLTLIYVNGLHTFEISSPKLEYMCFSQICLPIFFKSVTCLQSAAIESLVMVDDGEKRSLLDLFCSMPALNKLVLNGIFLEQLATGGVPTKLPTSTNLKVLQLIEISIYELDMLTSIFCLISSSPSIQRFEIEISSPSSLPAAAPIVDFLHDYAAEIILDKLLEVSITGFTGSILELEFIKLLLIKSPVLEKILVKNQWYTDEGTRFKLLKEIVRFKRASPMAEIIYE